MIHFASLIRNTQGSRRLARWMGLRVPRGDYEVAMAVLDRREEEAMKPKPRNNTLRFSAENDPERLRSRTVEPEKGKGRKRRPRVKSDEEWDDKTEPCGPPTEPLPPYRGEWGDVT
jgi:hypothetical protein